jgi:hypothetical protein
MSTFCDMFQTIFVVITESNLDHPAFRPLLPDLIGRMSENARFRSLCSMSVPICDFGRGQILVSGYQCSAMERLARSLHWFSSLGVALRMGSLFAIPSNRPTSECGRHCRCCLSLRWCICHCASGGLELIDVFLLRCERSWLFSQRQRLDHVNCSGAIAGPRR